MCISCMFLEFDSPACQIMLSTSNLVPIHADKVILKQTLKVKIHNAIIFGLLRTTKRRDFLLANKAHGLLQFRNI